MRHLKWTACLGIAAVAVLAVAGAFPHEEHEGTGHECVACHFLLCGAMFAGLAAVALAAPITHGGVLFTPLRGASRFGLLFLDSLPCRAPPA
ncbi:MAG: hypothetical protein JSV08_00920 [Acidobacteriota bacterium]|nr:MAG: hypothetical protein JSV08_00920 [Acidobacteriota bacterium]